MARPTIADVASRSLPMAKFKKTTPSGGVSAAYRQRAEKHGHTMKGGSFPIEDAEDLRKAKHDIGRASNPSAARSFINRRAKEMGLPGVGESSERKGRMPYSHSRKSRE
jgi:hypothetical protein